MPDSATCIFWLSICLNVPQFSFPWCWKQSKITHIYVNIHLLYLLTYNIDYAWTKPEISPTLLWPSLLFHGVVFVVLRLGQGFYIKKSLRLGTVVRSLSIYLNSLLVWNFLRLLRGWITFFECIIFYVFKTGERNPISAKMMNMQISWNISFQRSKSRILAWNSRAVCWIVYSENVSKCGRVWFAQENFDFN